MKYILVSALFLISLIFAVESSAEKKEPAGPAHLRTVLSPNYIIHTDLDEDLGREAAVRMTRMFEEYQRRTAGFSGEIKSRFPFFLFKNETDYYAAGGMEGSAGVFMIDDKGPRLMAIAGEKPDIWTWHVVQHEGFHQFAHAVIRGEIPPWINEGLAEYFGEAVFTGDAFVSGVIPPDRLRRIKTEINESKFLTIKAMMNLSHQAWNHKLLAENYDQAWAMIHFLAFGEDGKYQKPFIRLMNLISDGKPYLDAWREVFGNDDAAFQKRFEKWWLELPKDPTRVSYDRAIVLTLTSFLARANAQKQTFDNLDDFIHTAKTGQLKCADDDYLPPSLLKAALRQPATFDSVKLVNNKGQLPFIVAITHDGKQLTTAFTLMGGKVRTVTVAQSLAPILPASVVNRK